MKEIDFLPEWYKSGRRRQISYRTQYVGLAGILAVLMVWNFAAGHSLSVARAELSRALSEQAAAASASQQFAEISNSVRHLRDKAAILEKIDSRIDVASVLAEMSFLLGNRIVLSKVDFKAESFENRQGGRAPVNGSPLARRANNHLGNNKTSVGDVKFKIMLNGVAADASEVAKLVCRLEESPYFCLVNPSFSRNKKITVTKKAAGENFEVTEFEIGCYLANFHQSVGDS